MLPLLYFQYHFLGIPPTIQKYNEETEKIKHQIQQEEQNGQNNIEKLATIDDQH